MTTILILIGRPTSDDLRLHTIRCPPSFRGVTAPASLKRPRYMFYN